MNKQHLLNLTLLVGFSAFGTSVSAQTSINAASNSATIKGSVFDYSIGEMTMISTEKTGGLIVTQGYLQPVSKTPSTQAPSTISQVSTEQTMKVYPNPTQNILNIETFESVEGKVVFELMDASGKVIIHQDENLHQGSNQQTLDFSRLAAGSYFLLVKKTNSIEANSVCSYKIQKVN